MARAGGPVGTAPDPGAERARTSALWRASAPVEGALVVGHLRGGGARTARPRRTIRARAIAPVARRAGAGASRRGLAGFSAWRVAAGWPPATIHALPWNFSSTPQ